LEESSLCEKAAGCRTRLAQRGALKTTPEEESEKSDNFQTSTMDDPEICLTVSNSNILWSTILNVG